VNTSDNNQKPRRAAALHPRWRGLALAVAVCPVVLAAACASQTPPRAAARPPRVVAATRTRPAGPSSPPPASSAASPAPAAASPVPAAANPVPRCQEPNLAAGVSMSGYTIGGGQWGIIITLTNTGPGSCSLYGYPGLGLQDGAHHVLPSQTHWGPTYFAHDPGPSLIVLAPGQAASASVALSRGTQDTPFAQYLEVTPPGDYQYALVGLEYGTGDTNGDLHVTAMARDTTIYRGSPGGCGCSGAP
jgi:hypothetical protein